MSISISTFFKSLDISTIDIRYRYIEQGYALGGVGARYANASKKQIYVVALLLKLTSIMTYE